MKILLKSGADSFPVLIGDIEEAYISTDNGKMKVVLYGSNGRSKEFTPKVCNTKEAREQCLMLVEYIAQELKRDTRLIEIDEEAGFEMAFYGEIIALNSFPFGDCPENIDNEDY